MGCCGRSRPQPTRKLPELNVASALEMAREQFKKTADPHLIESRLRLCKSCRYLQQNLCHRCGCPLVRKVGIQEETCPLRKW
jgi:hypothetical protein